MSCGGGIGDERAGKVAFQDEAHEALFRKRARLTARGGAFAPSCGARTRTGGACPNPVQLHTDWNRIRAVLEPY